MEQKSCPAFRDHPQNPIQGSFPVACDGVKPMPPIIVSYSYQADGTAIFHSLNMHLELLMFQRQCPVCN